MTDYVPLLLMFSSTVLFLLLGIRTHALFAHIFSFISGAFLVSEAINIQAPFTLIWALALVMMYPAIQLEVMRVEMLNNGRRKKK